MILPIKFCFIWYKKLFYTIFFPVQPFNSKTILPLCLKMLGFYSPVIYHGLIAHINMIVTRAFMLGLIRRSFSHTVSVPEKIVIYLSCSFRSNLLLSYLETLPCVIVLEKLQRRATKFILNDYNSDYKTCLSSLNLLPLSMTLELNDIIFFLKSVRSHSPSFDILDYIHFSVSSGIRSSSTTSSSNFYFNRLPRLWNCLPSADDYDLSCNILPEGFFWSHFALNFNNDDPCSYHFLCLCSSCTHSSPNFTYL